MPQPDTLFLGHMLQALDRIKELLARTTREEFDGDWVVQDALIRELEIVGEAAGRVTPELARTHPEIPWKTAAEEASEVRPLIERALEVLRR